MSRKSVVAVIPPNLGFDPVLAAMRGMGKCYPEHTLFLDNNADGATLIVHDPDAPAPEGGRKRRRTKTNPDAPVAVSMGTVELGELLAYAFAPDTAVEDGAKAMAVWTADVIEQTEGAISYVTFTFIHPDGRRFALTAQKCDGPTPAERIHELEEQLAAATAQAEV